MAMDKHTNDARTLGMRLCSYNAQGIGSWDYINDLLATNDILLLQETWLRPCQDHMLSDKLSAADYVSVSAMDDAELATPQAGRPHGGCAIVWKTSLSCAVAPVTCIGKSVCAIKLSLPNSMKCLILCVYMPCDTFYDRDNLFEFNEVLDEMSRVCSDEEVDFVICSGDFNTDFSRLTSLHTQALSSFLVNENLCSIHNLDCYNVPFTFESKANGARSTLDHCFASPDLIPQINEANVSFSVDNMSDHYPLHVYFEIDLGPRSHPRPKPAKQLWAKATPECLNLYSQHLEIALRDIELTRSVTECRNRMCSDREHTADLQTYHDRIVECCLDAGSCIPKSNSSSRIVPGWNQCIKPVLQKALFWHQMWVQNDRPQNGIVADIRRHTRAQYHKAIKHTKAIGRSLKAAGMAERFASSERKEFWSEVAKMKSKGSSLPSSVGGAVGDAGIADMFRDRYAALYTSVGYDRERIQVIEDENNSRIVSHTGDCSAHVVEFEEVDRAVKSLKRNKHDGLRGFYSDHLKNAPRSILPHLARLFNGCILHGFSPTDFGSSVMVPIPKNKNKPKSDPENYRSIALSSILNKVLDKIFIKKCRVGLATSDNQFGFKANHSTAQCSFVVKEVVQHYVNGDSTVYACLLDASKAFDRIAYCRLFKILKDRPMCPLVIRFLLRMYSGQTACVRWGQASSNPFNIYNGVKQGGVISPVLFTIYLDVLLTRLVQSGAGCQLGSRPMGSFAYADDVILLAPSVEALKRMLSICEEYAREFDVQFNPSKSKVIVINGPPIACPISFMNGTLEVARQERHLGISFGNVQQKEVIDTLCLEMTRKTNMISAHFRLLPPDITYALFKTYCMPLYGCQLLDLDNTSVDRLFTTWRKCIRSLLKLPTRTHSRFLHLICNDSPIEIQLYTRFVKFFRSAISSGNSIVSLCAMLALNGSRSSISNSLSLISQVLNKSRFAIAHEAPSLVDASSKDDDPDDIAISVFIQNVLDDRWFTSVFPHHTTAIVPLNVAEINIILNEICTV